ncbi:MAG: hypothetical protein KKG40_03105, partial [Gammaproteobacteria bacterium]|nr:hypothetical protein [Gammaproteobacteria bacterium]
MLGLAARPLDNRVALEAFNGNSTRRYALDLWVKKSFQLGLGDFGRGFSSCFYLGKLAGEHPQNRGWRVQNMQNDCKVVGMTETP